MSMPNIPDINPDICLCYEDVINLMLSSIALEEIALSQIINAESEKVICFINHFGKCNSNEELIKLNTSVEKVLHEVGIIETLLLTKLKTIVEIYDFKDECNIHKLSKHCCNECEKCNFKNCNCENDCSGKYCNECTNCDLSNQECFNTVNKNNDFSKYEDYNNYKKNVNGIYGSSIDYYKNYNKLSNIFNKVFRGTNKPI